jgi:hypothetical protein
MGPFTVMTEKLERMGLGFLSGNPTSEDLDLSLHASSVEICRGSDKQSQLARKGLQSNSQANNHGD